MGRFPSGGISQSAIHPRYCGVPGVKVSSEVADAVVESLILFLGSNFEIK